MDLSLVLLSALQSLLYLLGHVLAGIVPVEEVAGAVFLHHLGPGKAGQLTEPVGAVNNGVATVALGVTQQEVTVCETDRRKLIVTGWWFDCVNSTCAADK